MAEGEDPKLKGVKTMIRSVVMSVKEGVPSAELDADYLDFAGTRIPFRDFGFSSLESFIRSMPDVVAVKTVQGRDVYFAVANSVTRDLQNLIQRQKTNPKKSKALKKGRPTRYPKTHSQLSRSPQQSWGSSGGGGWGGGGGGGGGYWPNQSRSFGRQKPALRAAPKRVRSPILPDPPAAAPFDSEKVSPLKVTFHPEEEGEWGERGRVIERRAWGDGGREIAQRALKAVVGQKQEDKKGWRSTYVTPPRFQKKNNMEKANGNGAGPSNVTTNARPAADDNGHTPEEVPTLPDTVKEWVARLLPNYSMGLWSSRLFVMYSEEFGHPAPDHLIDTVKAWTDVAFVELNKVADRYVIYPAAPPTHNPPATTTTTTMTTTTTNASWGVAPTNDDNNNNNNAADITGVGLDEAAAAPLPDEDEPPETWQNFIIPAAVLFSEQEEVVVYASTSIDLGNFYLQRTDSCADDITNHIQCVEQYLVRPAPGDLQPGSFCAALYSEDDRWYRAQVITIRSSKEVGVRFVDYGNGETVTMDNIRCLTDDIAMYTAQVVPCGLYALTPAQNSTKWSTEAIGKFHELLDTENPFVARCSLVEDGRCQVELWPGDNKSSVNIQLYRAGLVETYVQLDYDPADLELPQTGFLEVVVTYVDLKHCWLRIIGKDFSEALEMFEDRLGAVYRQGQGQPGRLHEDYICVAQFDRLYHRVKIREIKDNQAKCFFVDHGYTEWFPLDKLVPMDKDINKFLPYQAVWCLLVGLDIFMSNPITIAELLERSNKICIAEVIVREPLKVMLYDTNEADDVNINEEIAKRLEAEGHHIDRALFAPLPENFSEGSRSSSPHTGGGAVPAVPPASVPGGAATQAPGLTPSVPGEASESMLSDASTVVPGVEALSGRSEVLVPGDSSTPAATVPGAPTTARPPISPAVPIQTDIENLQVGAQALTLNNPARENSVIHHQTSVSIVASIVARAITSSSQQGGGVSVSATNVPQQGGGSSNPVVEAAAANPPYGDSLRVTYNAWSLPPQADLPTDGSSFPVYVQSVVDPSNFVIVPHAVNGSLEDMMMKMNARFNPTFAPHGDVSTVQPPTVAPSLQAHHLYMVLYNNIYYRAIFIYTTDQLHHVFLPDYQFYSVIGADDIFLLPKPFWTTPFCAFRGILYGVKPAGTENLWSESVKYKFTMMTQHKTLMGLVMGMEEREEGDTTPTPAFPTLYLHLVDTSDPDTDVVIADQLLESPNLVVAATV